MVDERRVAGQSQDGMPLAKKNEANADLLPGVKPELLLADYCKKKVYAAIERSIEALKTNFIFQQY